MFGKLFIALLASSLVIAAPVTPIESELEKRITHEGQATYFEVGLGACGWVSLCIPLPSKNIADVRDSGTKTKIRLWRSTPTNTRLAMAKTVVNG